MSANDSQVQTLPVLSTSLWAYCFSWLTLKEVSRLRLTASKWHLAASVCEATYALEADMLWKYHPSMPDCLSFFARYVPTVRSLHFDMKVNFNPDEMALKRARHVRSVSFEGTHDANVCNSVLMALPGPLLGLEVNSHIPSKECWDKHGSTLTCLNLWDTLAVPSWDSFAALKTLRLYPSGGQIKPFLCAASCIQQLDEFEITFRGDWNDVQLDPLRLQLLKRQADTSRPFQLYMNEHIEASWGRLSSLDLSTSKKILGLVDGEREEEERVHWAAWIHRDVPWQKVHLVSDRRNFTKSLVQLSYLGCQGLVLQLNCFDFDDQGRLGRIEAQELATWAANFPEGQVAELVLSVHSQNVDASAVLQRFPGLARIACFDVEQPEWVAKEEDLKQRSNAYATFFEPWRLHSMQRLVQKVYFPRGLHTTPEHLQHIGRLCPMVAEWCDLF